jgi:hypothetical protein
MARNISCLPSFFLRSHHLCLSNRDSLPHGSYLPISYSFRNNTKANSCYGLFCMRGMHICIPACMYSQALHEQKLHANKNQMQNINAASRPKFNVLSNGALVFVECIGKLIKLFTKLYFYSACSFSI